MHIHYTVDDQDSARPWNKHYDYDHNYACFTAYGCRLTYILEVLNTESDIEANPVTKLSTNQQLFRSVSNSSHAGLNRFY